MTEPTGARPAQQHPPGARQRVKYLTRAEWVRAIRGQIPQASYGTVARTLAEYADHRNGAHCRPGIETLMADTCLSRRTVRRALKWLRDAQLIYLQRRGTRKSREADTYRLCIPALLARKQGRWTDADGDPFDWSEERTGDAED